MAESGRRGRKMKCQSKYYISVIDILKAMSVYATPSDVPLLTQLPNVVQLNCIGEIGHEGNHMNEPCYNNHLGPNAWEKVWFWE